MEMVFPERRREGEERSWFGKEAMFSDVAFFVHQISTTSVIVYLLCCIRNISYSSPVRSQQRDLERRNVCL